MTDRINTDFNRFSCRATREGVDISAQLAAARAASENKKSDEAAEHSFYASLLTSLQALNGQKVIDAETMARVSSNFLRDHVLDAIDVALDAF